MVAKRLSGTDAGVSAEGASFKSTYQVYVSKVQPAGTYVGQVKYTLVHPTDAVEPNGPISIEKAYAKSGKQKYNGYYKMQEMSDSICSMVTLYDEASQAQLIDTRDNKVYYVAKLQDGNCWMTQNLDHDIVTTPGFYTNQNTDIGYNSSTHSYSSTSWTAQYATHSSSDAYWCDDHTFVNATLADCSYTTIASYDPGDLYWNGQMGNYGENQTSNSGNIHYHLGNYYNWSAATATNDISSLADNTLFDRSICPTGWTLPRPGTGADSFYGLLNEYGFTFSTTSLGKNIWDGPLYFGLLGTLSSIYDADVGNVGYLSSYWSSLLESNDSNFGTYVFTLYIAYDSVYPGDWDSTTGGATSLGHNIRCVARPVSNTIEGLD